MEAKRLNAPKRKFEGFGNDESDELLIFATPGLCPFLLLPVHLLLDL